MIQITDIAALSSLSQSLSSMVSVHGENWNDDVFRRIDSQYIAPVLTQLNTMASDADANIRQIVKINQEMELLASKY